MISYLDNGATTPLCPPAYEAMKQVAENTFGNPSSLHTLGMEAESVVERARQSVSSAFLAQKLGEARKPEQIVFTSGGTEANNLALLGAALSKTRFAGKTILVGESEHASVSACADHLAALGFRIVRIPSPKGAWDMDAYRAALDKNVILVSSMLVNNETGAFHQVEEIIRTAREVSPDILVHLDAVQAFCKFTLPRFPGADLISVSSHKIGGPKGVGALYLSERVLKTKSISPVLFGGGQENALRSGTENVIGIAGFGAAADYYIAHVNEHGHLFAELRAYLTDKLKELPENSVRINEPVSRVDYIVSLTVFGIRSETMLHALSACGVYVSAGSACSSNTHHASAALASFGLSDADADCTVRVSFGIQNTKEDIDALIAGLADGISHLAKKRHP